MKKLIIKYILFVSLFLHNIVISQNLIPNSSFEEYSICPDASGQIEYSIDWINPTIGTPDYYNFCSSTFGIPSYCNCSDIFQYAKSGGAYCGIWTYSPQAENVREYIQTNLKDSLKLDKCYHLSMYVNSSNWSAYANNGIGFHLSNNPISSTGNEFLLNYEPQVFIQNVIYDTLNWIQIHGVFKANGSERFLTIGNFFSDTEIVIEQHPNALSTQAAYYLIDDISLFQLGEGYLGKDSTILLGHSIFIGQDVQNLPSKWSVLGGSEIANNVSGILVSPIVTTTYVCEQNFCGEVMYDTITVTVVDDAGISTSSMTSNLVKIYPNPSNGEFYISISENNSPNQLLEILDMSGKLVYSDNIQFENGSIKLIRSLESGIYVFKLTDEQTKGQILKKVTISNSK